MRAFLSLSFRFALLLKVALWMSYQIIYVSEIRATQLTSFSFVALLLLCFWLRGRLCDMWSEFINVSVEVSVIYLTHSRLRLFLILILKVTRLEQFALDSLLISDNLRALMVIFESMLQADDLHALRTCERVDGGQLGIAFVWHALLYHLLMLAHLWLAFPAGRVLAPNNIRVLQCLHFESRVTDRTNYHVDAFKVSRQLALVIICTRVTCAVYKFAPVAFKGQEVLLVAERERTMLTNVSEFHLLIL